MAAVKEPVELAWSMKYLEFLIGPASEALGAGNHQPLYVVVTAGVNEVDGTEFWDIRHQVTELVVQELQVQEWCVKLGAFTRIVATAGALAIAVIQVVIVAED